MNWASELYCTAYKAGQFPPAEMPEIVFAGRSNVGKSTLVNSLLGRSIAKVSATPGKTRSINFYKVTDSESKKQFMLVDIPGYGYAARNATERKNWWKLINDYFDSQRNIFFVVHLIDFRHGPLANDNELTEWMDSIDMPRLVVFTKGDKIANGKRKGIYEKYVASGLESILPPYITLGKNDNAADSLRQGIFTAIETIEKTINRNC